VVFSLLGLVSVMLVLGLVFSAAGLVEFSPRALGWALPFGVLAFLFMLGTFVLAGRALRRFSAPLDQMVTASERVAEGDYSARVEEKGPPEMRSLARGLNSMAERLQMADQQRRQMFADVSHELRTPLTVIQGTVEGMLDGLYPADEKALNSILEETGLLSRLVDDLRTLSLAESGALQLKRENLDLTNLVDETVESFRPRAAAAGVRLTAKVQPYAPIEADPTRIREVLSNLISNALRYTPSGGSITVRLDGQTVSVQDNGAGIAPADLPHIFDRFYKSGDSGGTGLGLSISKYLVEAHGGSIWAESQPSQGTILSFRLPGNS
jgi:two-component system OmpR family sensor kinase/two-component system sensor histidine kinase BaeS